MRKQPGLMLITVLSLLLLGLQIAFAAAPADQAAAPATAAQATATKEDAPLKPQTTCPVLGNPIDKSAFTIYDGQKIYFCCPGCAAPFLKDAEKYMAKFAEQGVTVESVQTICPIMDNPINKDIHVDYLGRRVYFCCPGCVKTFNADPAKYALLLGRTQADVDKDKAAGAKGGMKMDSGDKAKTESHD